MSDARVPQSERQHWMSILAQAEPNYLIRTWNTLPEKPGYEWIVPPEFGSVMIRARTGRVGTLFNLGELTITRCVVRLEGGTIGHACVGGRNQTHAAIAAALDGMLVEGRTWRGVAQGIVDNLTKRENDRQTKKTRSTQATRVEFSMNVSDGGAR